MKMKRKSQQVKNWWEQDKTISWIISYSLIAIVVLAGIFYTFIRLDKSLIWKQDGLYTYLPSLAYGGHYIREFLKNILQGDFVLPMYDFSYGMGMNVYSLVVGMFTDPFKLIAVVFPMNKVELAYNIGVLMRLYCIGLAFLSFSRYRKWDRISSLTGAVIYMASGYAIFAGLRHPHFLTAMAILPLLFIGVEKTLQKKGILLAILIGVSMANSYYFTFMMSFIIIIYAIIRFFDLYKENRVKHFRKLFLRYVISYVIGIGMAAFAYVPQILNFIDSVRTGEVIATDSLFLYDAIYYEKLITAVITPLKSAGYWVWIGAPAISLLVIAYVLIQRKKEFLSDKITFLAYTVLLCVPLFSYILSGFNSISNRWSYAYTFFVAILVAKYLKRLDRLSKKESIALFTVTALYGLMVIIRHEISNQFTLIGAVMLCISLALIFLFNHLENIKTIWFQYAILLLVIGNVVVNARYIYFNGNVVGTFAQSGEGFKQIIESPYQAMSKIEDDSFYRVEQIDHSFASGNRGLVQDLNTTAQYSNINCNNYNNYHEKLANNGVKDIVMVYDLDGRTILNTLASVKYYAVKNGKEQNVPYGYTLKTKTGKYSIYENQYALPIGYTYDSYLLESEYNTLSMLDKQYAMLQGAIVEKDIQKVEHLDLATATDTTIQLPVLKMDMKNVSIDNNTIKVTRDNGRIVLSFHGVPNAETYVLIKNLKVLNDTYDSNIIVKYNGLSKTNRIQGSSRIYKSQKEDYLTNVGEIKEGLQTITIQFAKAGEFTFDSISLVSQPMKGYEDSVYSLKKEALENIMIGQDFVSGTVTVAENRLLCFSIPYHKGWALTVDGEKVDLIQMNGMYMGTELTKGYHTIHLDYHVPGAKLGFIVSFISVFCMFLYKKNIRKIVVE